MSNAIRSGLARRVLRTLWRASTACLVLGVALAPSAPPPPPPPPPHVEVRERGGQPRGNSGGRVR